MTILKMNKAESRIAIAKDVLANLKNLKVTSGDYCYLPPNKRDKYLKISDNEQLQKILPKFQKDCDVCALGACFLSYVRFFNKVSIEDVNDYNFALDRNFISDRLEKFFSLKQMELIETAFEGDVIEDNFHQYKYLQKVGDFYYVTYPKIKDRLSAIMKNIIENKGIFKPPSKKELDKYCEEEIY